LKTTKRIFVLISPLLLGIVTGWTILRWEQHERNKVSTVPTITVPVAWVPTLTVAPAMRTWEPTMTVPPPLDHPPLKIVIGSKVVSVEYVSHEYLVFNNAVAMSNWKEKRLVLDAQENPLDARETVMHELMHLACESGGGVHFSGEGAQDDFIEPTAGPLLLILRDNPKLRKWLTQ
jgi:hypothetical protein